MNDVHSPRDSGAADIENLDEAVVNRKWLYSLIAYYVFALGMSFLPVILFIEPFVWYDMRLLLYPGLHYYFYRKASIYWFMLFTSLALSVGITHGVLMELLVVLRMKSFIGLFLWWIHAGLFVYFIYNCFQLLKVNVKNNLASYHSVVKNLWVLSLLACYGLSYLQSIHSLHYGFKVDFIEGLAIFCADITRGYLSYYCAIRRRGTFALLVILIFFPWPVSTGGDVSSILNRLSWFGFFIYFCISTYRLYKVNRTERKEVIKAGDDLIKQINI